MWPLANWAALLAVLVGTTLAYVGFQRILAPPPVLQTLETPIRTVASGVPADATATNSIGQQRVVRTSDGHLLSLFATEAGLSIASDLGDHGRSWRAPVTIPAIAASSLSAAAAPDNRIQLAFVNDQGPAFAALDRTRAGWQASTIVQLDDSSSPIVDVAWDPLRELAHVVWVAESDEGSVVRWASLASNRAGVARLLESDDIAAIRGGSALANIAAGPGGQLIVTYRKGDAAGWFSRSLTDDSAGWQPEEALPVDFTARAGAVAMDRRGLAHVVLIEESGDEMLYLRRSSKGWLAPQTAVAQGTTEEMDSPFLATDASSKLLYAFFSTTGTADALRVVVNDPAGGWEEPYRISVEDNTTEGHSPTALDPLTGTPLVLWTSTGATPAIHSGNIVLP